MNNQYSIDFAQTKQPYLVRTVKRGQDVMVPLEIGVPVPVDGGSIPVGSLDGYGPFHSASAKITSIEYKGDGSVEFGLKFNLTFRPLAKFQTDVREGVLAVCPNGDHFNIYYEGHNGRYVAATPKLLASIVKALPRSVVESFVKYIGLNETHLSGTKIKLPPGTLSDIESRSTAVTKLLEE